ncbi:MAG: ADP-forming succinate--CoA ligase subunit beta [Promethearchaeota archaeon]
MRLLEYESKDIFEKFGIPLAKRIVIRKDDNLKEKVSNFTFPAIIKSQIAIGSRKKAGLIKVAENSEEAINLCNEFFSKEISGFKVEAILIEELADIQHEYYCSVALDASGRQFYLIASAEGGIDIEEVSATNPDAIIKENFSFKHGLDQNMAKSVAERLGFSNEVLTTATEIFQKLWKITVEIEAQLVEINPLVLTPSGLIAVDGKMILDDDAAFRQPITQKLLKTKVTDLEKFAKDAGFFFVKLDGDLGILSNGAGLTMSFLDVLSGMGLKPANFLDLGGGANKERVYKALELLFKLNPKCILINIFGGITRCDIIAEAIVQALVDFEETPPMVIRLIGTKEKEGMEILKKKGINAYKEAMDAINKVKEVMGA